MLRFLEEQQNHKSSILLRSSARQEVLSSRGLLVSREVHPVADDIASSVNALWDINLARLGGSDEDALALMVQPLMHSLSFGHLSNERRVSARARSWLSEETSKQPVEASRIEPSGQYDPETPLLCADRRGLVGRLREVASRRDSKGARRHYEWTWDGRQLWIVQADKEIVRRGIAPNSVWFSRPNAPPPAGLHIFRPEDSTTGKYRKTESCGIFRASGVPTPHLFVLEDREVLTQLATNVVGPELKLDLETLVAGPIVIRTDVSETVSAETANLLPMSDALVDVDHAAAFLTKAAAKMTALTKNPGSFCFIAHRFIPARAGAWSLADSSFTQVLIDATWGSPDGLLVDPHDTYEVYPNDSDQDWVQIRCKSRFIDLDANGHWIEREAGWPWDWRPSLSPTQRQEIAEMSLAIAKQRDGPSATMFFVGVAPDSGYPDCLPWISLRQDRLTKARSAPAHFAGVSRLIRQEHDLDLVMQDMDAGLFTGRLVLVLRPVEQLIRDEGFLRRVALRAKQLNATVYLEGSILTHTYYMLRREGVQVMTPPLDKMPPERQRSFSKLVRSGIPAAVERHGESSQFYRASPAEIMPYLKQKAVEEASELQGAATPAAVLEEAADLLEVLKALADALGVDFKRLQDRAEEKRVLRGGFEEGIVLKSTSSPSLLTLLASDDDYLIDLPTKGGASTRPPEQSGKGLDGGRRIIVEFPAGASHRETVDLVIGHLPKIQYAVHSRQRGTELLLELSPASAPAAGEQLRLFD
jgi:predicted house-cleaning noncanonical NTP pyrophosphatase (MazG superfamily)